MPIDNVIKYYSPKNLINLPVIQLETRINGAIDICFDLSTSIDLHTLSTSKTNEKAIAGTTTGLIKSGETVTWQATHFGVKQKLTSKITEYKRPFHFRDEQQKGAFKYIRHGHYFSEEAGVTVMKDIFDFASPLGILGKIFDKLVLTRYLTRFLAERNRMIKQYAESEGYLEILK